VPSPHSISIVQFLDHGGDPTRVCYAMNFVRDRPATGLGFKCLTMTDPCSKEVPVIWKWTAELVETG